MAAVEQVPKWKPPTPTQHDLPWADILTVDLSKYDTDREELVKTVSTALERDGFFYVVGHGIPLETLSRQVSREEKERHRARIAEEGSFMGYKVTQNYWEIKDGVRDRIEHYNFYKNSAVLLVSTPVTRHPEPLRPHVEEIKEFLEETRQKYWGLQDGHLWLLHETEGGEAGDDLLRYMIYDPLTEEESTKTNGVMLNGHTDFNSISTLVFLMPDNVWRYVKHKDGALVINIGDQLSFMSGGILKGTMHRVVRPPPDQAHLRRLGVFHFAHFIRGIPLDLLPSEKVHKEGWERTRIKSYERATFIKGEEFDIEIIAGLQARILSRFLTRRFANAAQVRHYH
ncbi:hypothetical protein B0H14DRAFT_2711486 [Mycena olivaceomarginata]|nr:hypothetical protein B0H14DRAFT_2711486 [Mycena olivaceomarginata]